MQMRRLTSGLAGSLLMLGTLFETCRGSFGLYQEHYLIPKEKFGVLTPLRLQDVVFMAAFFLILAALFYVAYRLLKYAFGSQGSVIV